MIDDSAGKGISKSLNDLVKDSLSKDALQQKVKGQFSSATNGSKTIYEEITDAAAGFLPVVQGINSSRAQLQGQIMMVIGLAGLAGSPLSKSDYVEISDELMDIERDDIFNALDMLRGSTVVDTKADMVIEHVNNVPEYVSVDIAKAIFNVLPLSFYRFITAEGGADPQKTENEVVAAVRQQYADVNASTQGQLRGQMQKTANAVPNDMVADMLYEVLQNCTPQNLETAVDHIVNNMSAQDYTDIAMSALDFAEEFCKAAARGKQLQVDNKRKAAPFGSALARTFLLIEDAMDKAGITPDTISLDDIEAELKKNKSAPGNNSAPSLGRP